jgi:hypothetical protein
MLPPSLILALVLSSFYGLLFYLIFGHGWSRLIFYWTVGVFGFILGEWIASALGLTIFSVGELNLVEGSLVSWVSLFAVRAWRR